MSKCPLSKATLLLGILCLNVSCSLYHKEFNTKDDLQPNYELRIVQVDDFGSWWNPQKAQDALDLVRRSTGDDDQTAPTNTYVVLFIHGWHHNADENNTLLNQFRNTLRIVGERLASPGYTAARQQITGKASFKLIGIYVGWRGRALPSGLDYASVWWRKTAAERVGDGDVGEFIERLHRIYLRSNSLEKCTKVGEIAPRKPYMGLVSIGHSFGAQVLLKSIARPLEYYLTERAPMLARTLEAPSVVPDDRRRLQRVPIDSFGDVNILLNPALEAYQFAKIDSLYRQLDFTDNQSPQLVVFSASNDWARHYFFPAARAVTRPFRPGFRSDYQKRLFIEALGEFEPQQTHTLEVEIAAEDSLLPTDHLNGERLAQFDFTGDLSFSDLHLKPMPDRRVKNSPVAAVGRLAPFGVEPSGIFEHQFSSFLIKYVDFIEGKNLALRKLRWQAKCPTKPSDGSTPKGANLPTAAQTSAR